MQGIVCEGCGRVKTLRVLNARAINGERKARTCECSECSATMVTVEISKNTLAAERRQQAESTAYIKELKAETRKLTAKADRVKELEARVKELEREKEAVENRSSSRQELDVALNLLSRGARIVRRHGEVYQLMSHEKRFLSESDALTK